MAAKFFAGPSKPSNPLHLHRVLSPTAGVRVSPIVFGGISIGSAWSDVFGKNEDPDALLDAFFEIGGNFIDTACVYNDEESEKLIGLWMEKRKNRDQIVLATKYTAGYRTSHADEEPMQSNTTGCSIKNMHVSVRESLRKLRTDYVDILYVHWWDETTSVEEIMRGLHVLVMAGKVLYLGASDLPAWIVVKANMFARQHGMTPFSVYQGRWNAAFRDMEAELIPMCEDQGMAIIPWAALGGGSLLTRKQREEREQNPAARPARKTTPSQAQADERVSAVLERIADEKGTTLQACALAYLFAQSTHVFPIVGVNTVAHVKAMPDALRVQLDERDIKDIHEASGFFAPFPISMLHDPSKQPYSLALTGSHNLQTRMAAWIQAPPRRPPYSVDV